MLKGKINSHGGQGKEKLGKVNLNECDKEKAEDGPLVRRAGESGWYRKMNTLKQVSHLL